MADSILKQREAEAATLTEIIRESKRYIASHNVSLRLMKQKLYKIDHAKEELLKKHYAFAEKSGKEFDSEELIGRITPKLDEATDISDELFIYIEELEEKENETKLKEESTIAENKLLMKTKDESVILRMQLEATEKIIKDRLNEMIAIINDTNRNSLEDRELVGAHIREVESFMDEQTKSWNKLKIINIDNVDEMEELFANENELKMIVSYRRLLASTFMKLSAETIEKPVKKEVDVDARNKDSIHLQKMKPPSFSRNI